MTAIDSERIARCCDRHADWQTLTEHLVVAFPDAPADDIVRELVRAKEAIDVFGVPEEDRLGVTEVMVWHRLAMLTGRIPDIARLDPERHDRSTRTV
jgi:hypothetical protein